MNNFDIACFHCLHFFGEGNFLTLEMSDVMTSVMANFSNGTGCVYILINNLNMYNIRTNTF